MFTAHKRENSGHDPESSEERGEGGDKGEPNAAAKRIKGLSRVTGMAGLQREEPPGLESSGLEMGYTSPTLEQARTEGLWRTWLARSALIC